MTPTEFETRGQCRNFHSGQYVQYGNFHYGEWKFCPPCGDNIMRGAACRRQTVSRACDAGPAKDGLPLGWAAGCGS